MREISFPDSEISLFVNGLPAEGNYLLTVYKRNNGESIIMESIINDLEKYFSDQLDFLKISFSKAKIIRDAFNIQMGPSFILAINGNPVELIQGLVSFHDLKLLIEAHINKSGKNKNSICKTIPTTGKF